MLRSSAAAWLLHLALARGLAADEPICRPASKVVLDVPSGPDEVRFCDKDYVDGKDVYTCLGVELSSGKIARFPEPTSFPDVPAPFPAAPQVTVTTTAREVTVCRDDGKTCTTFVPAGYRPRSDDIDATVNASGTTVAVKSAAKGGRDQVALYRVDGGGKRLAAVARPPDRSWSCGGASWVGDALVVAGRSCKEEEWSKPWFASPKTGKLLARGGGTRFKIHYEDPVQPVSLGEIWAFPSASELLLQRSSDGRILGRVDLTTISEDPFERLRPLPSGEVLIMFRGDVATFDPRTGKHRRYDIKVCGPL
jgi:hypothetical protein